MARKCKRCGRSIEHKHPNAKFCGQKCKDRYHNTMNPRGYGLRRLEESYDNDGAWDEHNY